MAETNGSDDVAPVTAHLYFICGALSGISAPVRRGISVIGSGGEATLLVPGIEETTVELDTRRWSALFGPKVRLLSGAASLDGKPLAEGRARRVAKEGTLSIDETVIRIEPIVSSVQTALSAAPVAAVASIGLVMLLFAGGTTPGYSGLPVQQEAAEPVERVTAGKAAAALRLRLDEFDLPDVRVEPDDDARVVRVTGAIAPEAREGWNEARIWFDNSFGGAVVLDPNLIEKPSKVVLPVAIRSVWLEPIPTLIDHTGRRRHIGDELGDGWFVDAIDAETVTIERDGRRLVFTP